MQQVSWKKYIQFNDTVWVVLNEARLLYIGVLLH